MKKILSFILFVYFLMNPILAQQSYIVEKIDDVVSLPLPSPTSYTPSINLTGNLHELVIAVGLPDRSNNYPPINSDVHYPPNGKFLDGTLLEDYVTQHGGSISADTWYQPFFNDYFNFHSGDSTYKVNFRFVKSGLHNGTYTTTTSMTDWITANGSSNNVIYNKLGEMLQEISDNIYNDDNNVFVNISCIHFVFIGVSSSEFWTEGGGTVSYDFQLKNSTGTITYWRGPITYQIDMNSIPHERMHIIGAISGYPPTGNSSTGFWGFPDRGFDRSPDGSHHNLSGPYDIMFHSGGGSPGKNSLFACPPITSHDLIFLGWINPSEILTVNNSNINTIDFNNIKLTDINVPLNATDISQGKRRIIKVMIHENYFGDRDEYF